jgi:purine-nucleoside phosphorylase
MGSKKQSKKMTKSIEIRQNYKSFKMYLDKSLSEKVYSYAQENEMKITGLLRLALKDFFESKEKQEQSVN